MMIDHDAFMVAWRGARLPDGRKIAQAEYDLIMAAINGTWAPSGIAAMVPTEPAWLAVARSLLGTKEVVGPQHNPWIVKAWARLGAKWFNDDETPWCGLFVAHCIDAAGLPYPGKGEFARAKAWRDWGKSTIPSLGAVVVFERQGGGHVGFLVGESPSAYYVLGGNQGNTVTIAPFDKIARKPIAFRWPASLPASIIPLPKMTGGTVSRSEA